MICHNCYSKTRQSVFECIIGDVAMCKSIEEATKLNEHEIYLILSRLSPSDLECLTIFLTCSSHKEWKKLNLWNCHIQDHGLQILQRGLRSSDITITELWLDFNDLTAVSSSVISDLTISCRVKELNIRHNNIVGEDYTLYRIITDRSSMVEELDMSNTTLSSNGAIKLFTALSEAKKLRILWIDNNEFNDEACDAITMTMKNTSLFNLYMHNNPISEECAQLIVQALQHNNTLRKLWLNNGYHGDVKEKIRSLQEEVNKKRETHGCQVKLEIYFSL